MNRKAVIFGIQGHRLTNNEKLLFKKVKPWGIILFSRNIKNISQLKNLIDDIKNFFNDKKYPILIDQEGGKVSRLNKITNLNESNIDLIRKNHNLFTNFLKKYKNIFTNFKILKNHSSAL